MLMSKYIPVVCNVPKVCYRPRFHAVGPKHRRTTVLLCRGDMVDISRQED